MHVPPFKLSWSCGLLLAALWAPVRTWAGSPPVITNVSVVNVTPANFSVVCVASGDSASISVFADPAGLTNLAGQVGIELYPLHTGDPLVSDAYARRLSQASLRQKTRNQGLVQVRVSHCAPGTTYYYRLQAGNADGQAFWPAAGPLPAVTTAQENAFVVQSQQLMLNLPGFDPAGSIVILSNSNTPSLLAAVAGDGVASNQVFFSVSDLLAAAGSTNYLPLGNQQFTAQVLGNSSNGLSQVYSLYFTGDFLVGEENRFDLGTFAGLRIGSAVSRAGESGSVPIQLYASAITNLTLTLNLPTNRFSALSLQPLSSQVGSSSLSALDPNTVRVVIASAAGQTLNGQQDIAQFNFTTTPNQTSAFVPLAIQLLSAVSVDGSSVNNFAAQSGRVVVVADEPLLEASLTPGGGRNLALYGKPWASYQLQSSTNLNLWSNSLRVPMTNLVELFSGIDTAQPALFFRAYELMANPPLLEARLAGQNRSLLVYGVPGTNYQVQYATNLSGVVAWYPLLSYTLTNSFQSLTGIGNTSPVIFYRLKQP